LLAGAPLRNRCELAEIRQARAPWRIAESNLVAQDVAFDLNPRRQPAGEGRMPLYLDRQEVQTAKSRDASLFRDLKGILSFAKGRAPALREQLRGVDLSKIRTRVDLARIPVLRKSDLVRLQQERPPLGGVAARPPGALKRILTSPGPFYLAEGYSKDWWRAARAMNAAGFEKGDVVLNGFCYDVGAAARIAESGAHALGCAIMPIYAGKAEWQAEVVEKFGATAYCGPIERLRELIAALERRKRGEMPIRKALCFDATADDVADDRFRRHCVEVHFCYATDELGVIAYGTKLEGGARAEDLVVNEGMIVEIVEPGTGDPTPFGSVGEVVVTRLNSDVPLLRFATGDLAALLPGPSPCGRTNLRLRKGLGQKGLGQVEQKAAERAASCGQNAGVADVATVAPLRLAEA
jgi:phenylacetate-CoA ligase